MKETLLTGNLGYPRIGREREWKKALEGYWAGRIDEAAFLLEMERIKLEHIVKQRDAGLDFIPVNDFSFYDQMLDMATGFGVVPERFGAIEGEVPLSVYYAMARGSSIAAACEMTKWFNTNYHYIVPEIGDKPPYLAENRPLEAYRFAKSHAGVEGRPVVVGLYTFLKLSKGFDSSRLAEKVSDFLPVYVKMLQELEQEGVAWVQVDEPSLVQNPAAEELELIEHIYRRIQQQVPQLQLLLQTYFEAVEPFEKITRLPVAAIGLDFVHDNGVHLQGLRQFGWPQDKLLAAGIIDGRNIWRADLDAKLTLIQEILHYTAGNELLIQPSCSLLHVPVSTESETELPVAVRQALSFADEKLSELAVLARFISEGQEAVRQQWDASRQAHKQRDALPERNRADVASAMAALSPALARRRLPFADRFRLQADRWKLPPLPTTTIGSFPQTKEVRQARRKWRQGQLDDQAYQQFINGEIEACIRIQEKLDIDVLVHGEFERTDMVEFFGENLDGFVFTKNGWVQSYGSRCVKPPVIYADVAFAAPMTVKESAYAQSLTSRPVKGMLTGPITILNWSFVRDDLPRKQVAFQLALALQQEVEALEQAGIGMIQVDEPAMREGLPLKKRDQADYLNWAIEAFRITTSSVQDMTQIHTHMCYCEFHDMIDSILALDADVISIETSRSHGELVSSFELNNYDHGIGLGVYDIHSPRVPDIDEMMSMVDRALRVLHPQLFWINPDCGLKTRGWQETVDSLNNMVEAARLAREKYGLSRASD